MYYPRTVPLTSSVLFSVTPSLRSLLLSLALEGGCVVLKLFPRQFLVLQFFKRFNLSVSNSFIAHSLGFYGL